MSIRQFCFELLDKERSDLYETFDKRKNFFLEQIIVSKVGKTIAPTQNLLDHTFKKENSRYNKDNKVL